MTEKILQPPLKGRHAAGLLDDVCRQAGENVARRSRSSDRPGTPPVAVGVARLAPSRPRCSA
eukprot:1730082-Pyramimonas_sp.AAC.1